MAVGVKVTVQFYEDRLHNLLEGPSGPVYKHMDALAEKVKVAAVNGAPVKTGKLRRSIKRTRDWPGLARNAVAVVADTDYALAVEKGSRPHTIRPKNATMLRFPSRGGGIVFAHSVDHPGTKANPFMQRALESVRR